MKPAKLSFDAAQRAVSAKLRLGQAATALRVVLLLLMSGAFSYARRTPALTRLNYTVWTSTDLVNRTQDAGAIQTSGIAVNQVETVAVVLSPGLLTNAKLFVRLRAAP